MDLKTQRRIKAYEQKQKDEKVKQRIASGDTGMTDAERQRRQKLAAAKKKRPGFGSSCSSVADHLNEVVGLTEHKATMREMRDKRIETAAKQKQGVNRYVNPNSKSMGTGHALGKAPGGQSTSSGRVGTGSSGHTTSSMPRNNNGNNQERTHNARLAFLDRLQAQSQAEEKDE